tara:strand:- start:1552 stop:2016 length:465 start_codon:yes stop_codon:yes gene_type:complete
MKQERVLISIFALAEITEEINNIKNVFEDLNLTQLQPQNHVFNKRYNIQPSTLSEFAIKMLQPTKQIKILLEADDIESLSDQITWVNKWFKNIPCILKTDIDIQLPSIYEYMVYPTGSYHTLVNNHYSTNKLVLGSPDTANWARVVASILHQNN